MRLLSTSAAALGGHTDARAGFRLIRFVRLARLTLTAALLALLVVGLAPRAAGPLGAAPAAASDDPLMHLSAADRAAAHADFTRLLALGGTTQTKWGPLTAADREVLIRVRQANLWERPVSLMAQQRAGDQKVKDVGLVLAADHLRLDELIQPLAKQLGMDLPDVPNPLQQGWVTELSGMRGQQFDVTWANRLRSAHGTVFGIIAEDRGATENTLVRQFAQVGVEIGRAHV